MIYFITQIKQRLNDYYSFFSISLFETFLEELIESGMELVQSIGAPGAAGPVLDALGPSL